MTKLTVRLSALAISLALLTAGFGGFAHSSAAPSQQNKTVIADMGGGNPDPCGSGCMVAVHSS